MTAYADSKRSFALDFLRGVTVAFMIVVNSPGSFDYNYAPLQHAIWHGFTPTDLVFPTFMFVIGVSMWYSFGKYERSWSPGLLKKIVLRVVVLFIIGLLLNKFPWYWKDWSSWRIMGVPQRLALGYGLAAILALSFSVRHLLAATASLLLLYWGILLFFAPDSAHPFEAAGSAVLRLDKWVFGEAHLYQELVAPGVRIPFDPEGLLSTLPAIASVLLGWICGALLHDRKEDQVRAARDLAFLGLGLVFAGLLWDLAFPINKKLWTSSYTLFSGGLSMLLLSISIWTIDVRRWRNGTGLFLAFGANALFAYVLSELAFISLNLPLPGGTTSLRAQIYPQFAAIFGTNLGSLMFAIGLMLFCGLVCRLLMHKQIFIKI